MRGRGGRGRRWKFARKLCMTTSLAGSGGGTGVFVGEQMVVVEVVHGIERGVRKMKMGRYEKQTTIEETLKSSICGQILQGFYV